MKIRHKKYAILLFVAISFALIFLVLVFTRQRDSYILVTSTASNNNQTSIDYEFRIPNNISLRERHFVDGEIIVDTISKGYESYLGYVSGSATVLCPKEIYVSENSTGDAIRVQTNQKITLVRGNEVLLYSFVNSKGEVVYATITLE